MNQHRLKLFCLNSILAASFSLLVVGCASSRGYKQADKTGEGITTVRTDVANIKTAVDGSLKALDDLVAASHTDPRKPYEAFAKSVDKVEAAGDTAKKDAEKMRARAADYFRQWDKQLDSVKSEEIKKLSQERKAKLQETFDEIKDAAEDAKESFPGFLSDLKDLRTALGSDLSSQGIDSAKEIIQKTRNSGAQVQKDLEKLMTEMNSAAEAITAAKAPPKNGTQKSTPKSTPS
jgi:methyl-accepting chemotaxis protein